MPGPFGFEGYSKVPSARVCPATPSPRRAPLTTSPSMNSPSGAIRTYLILAAGEPSSNLIEPLTMKVPVSPGVMHHWPGLAEGQLRVAKQQCLELLPGPRHQELLTAPAAGLLNVSGWRTSHGSSVARTKSNSVRR